MKYILTSLLILLSISGWARGRDEHQDTMQKSDTMMRSANTMQAEETMENTIIIPDEEGFFSTSHLQPGAVPYTSEEAAMSLAEKGPVIYFFGATWCPTCRIFVNDLGRNIDLLPRDVTLIFVNYDSRKALKNKYDIVSQHTFVQIDQDGNQKAIWSGSLKVEDLLKKIVRH